MMKALRSTATIGAICVTAILPASAQVGRMDPGLRSDSRPFVQEAQFRRRPGAGFGQHRGFGGGYGQGGYRGGYGRHRGGFGVGAGIAGLAAGALIGGAIASQAAPDYGYAPVPADDGSAYCAQRFRSYDPGSGTYVGYDGVRHSCP